MGLGVVGSVPPCHLPRWSLNNQKNLCLMSFFFLMLSGLVTVMQLSDGSTAFAISLGKVVSILRLTKWQKGKACSMVRIWSGLTRFHLTQDLMAGVDS